MDDKVSIGGKDNIYNPKQHSTSNGGEQMRMAICVIRGKGGGGDRCGVNNNDNEAIGGDNVCHPKQQSTNNGGEQMWMVVCMTRGGSGTRGGGGSEAAGTKTPTS